MMRCNFLAFLGAFDARVGAFLTMFHIVLAAFLSAETARRGAVLGEGWCLLRFAREQFCRHNAEQGTIEIELNAAGHHLHAFLFQTQRRATFTLSRAAIAHFNARFKNLVHIISFEGDSHPTTWRQSGGKRVSSTAEN
jgi:hypothetical protein